MIMCVCTWVSEGIPCFAFINFYILRGRRNNLCGCMVYVKVITYIFHCVHLFCGTDVVISVVYAKD